MQIHQESGHEDRFYLSEWVPRANTAGCGGCDGDRGGRGGYGRRECALHVNTAVVGEDTAAQLTPSALEDGGTATPAGKIDVAVPDSASFSLGGSLLGMVMTMVRDM